MDWTLDFSMRRRQEEHASRSSANGSMGRGALGPLSGQGCSGSRGRQPVMRFNTEGTYSLTPLERPLPDDLVPQRECFGRQHNQVVPQRSTSGIFARGPHNVPSGNSSAGVRLVPLPPRRRPRPLPLPPTPSTVNASTSDSEFVGMDLNEEPWSPENASGSHGCDDTVSMQGEALPLVVAHEFPESLWLRLYANSPNGECFGYALCRILVEGLTLSREALRRNLGYHAQHWNALNPDLEFPSTIEQAMKLVCGDYENTHEHVFYEVCPNKCDYMFPVITWGTRRKHCLLDHVPCGLCKCPTCGGRRFVVWNNNVRGIVRPNAGGVYLGLPESFLNMQRAPGFSKKRDAFLQHLRNASAEPEAQHRTPRFHSSPEYHRLCQHFDTNDSNPNRAKHMFYTLFWDGLSIMRLTKDYSVNVLMVHSEDMPMRDIGCGPYAVPVLLTNGPHKKGLSDAHLQLLFADIKKAAYEGFGGMRYVLSGLQADRPAMEDLLGLRGHTNKTGCGFCFGGTGYIDTYTRYYGYSLQTTACLTDRYKPKLQPKPIRCVDLTVFKEEAAKAAEGDTTALLHRSPAILTAAPWLDVTRSATFPVAHILANAVGKKFMQQFSGTSTKPATVKIPKALRSSLAFLLSTLILPHDAGRGSEIFGPHRSNMTITDIITSVTMFLPLVFSVAFQHANLSIAEMNKVNFLKYECETLCLAIRWYYYGWSLPMDTHGNSLLTFESKSRFAHSNALYYATLVEASCYLPGLTYGLHAFVTHFTEQELERGGMACTNELWGERGLKKVADIAKGRTTSHNVELTIANQLNLQRHLMSLEQGLKDRGLLIDGKSMLGLDESVFFADRCEIMVLNLLRKSAKEILLPFQLTQVPTLDVNILSTPLYASAKLSTGEVVHGESYARLQKCTSRFVMFMHRGVATYGSVCCFYKLADEVLAVMELLPFERHHMLRTVVELRLGAETCLLVPAADIRCKLVVLPAPEDPTLCYATECLHVRVSEEC